MKWQSINSITATADLQLSSVSLRALRKVTGGLHQQWQRQRRGKRFRPT
jgi:hypothetical protein